MQDFVMIPRWLPLRADLSSKRVVAYSSALFINWNGDNLDELLLAGGYSPFDRHKNGVRSQYKQLVSELDLGRVTETGGTFTSNERLRHGFGIIRDFEFEKIIEAGMHKLGSGQSANQADALLLLSLIRCSIFKEPGQPQYYSNLISRISSQIGISPRSVSAAIGVLEQLEIIHSQELPRYQDNLKRWHSNVRIFVEYSPPNRNGTYNWVEETTRGIQKILAQQVT